MVTRIEESKEVAEAKSQAVKQTKPIGHMAPDCL